MHYAVQDAWMEIGHEIRYTMMELLNSFKTLLLLLLPLYNFERFLKLILSDTR